MVIVPGAIVEADACVVYAADCIVQGNGCMVYGDNCIVEGDDCTVVGARAVVRGQCGVGSNFSGAAKIMREAPDSMTMSPHTKPAKECRLLVATVCMLVGFVAWAVCRDWALPN